MFTIEQIHDIHDRLGTMERFPDYVRALTAIGVESYDSYLSDGHSEYFAEDGRSVVSAAVHEVLPVNDASDREQVVEHLGLHELGRTSYLEMSKGLADSGVEKWTVDTKRDDAHLRRQAGPRAGDRGDLVVAVATSDRLPPVAAWADAADARRRLPCAARTSSNPQRVQVETVGRVIRKLARACQSYFTSWTSTPPGCFRNEVYILAKSCRCGAALVSMPAATRLACAASTSSLRNPRWRR